MIVEEGEDVLIVGEILFGVGVNGIDTAVHVQVTEIEQFGQDWDDVTEAQFYLLELEVLVLGLLVLL